MQEVLSTVVLDPLEGQETKPLHDRDIMLYVPGLDFTGVSACGQFPKVAERYDLWRMRTSGDDRTPLDELTGHIAEFVLEQMEEHGKDVYILSESMGAVLTLVASKKILQAQVARRNDGQLDGKGKGGT